MAQQKAVGAEEEKKKRKQQERVGRRKAMGEPEDLEAVKSVRKSEQEMKKAHNQDCTVEFNFGTCRIEKQKQTGGSPVTRCHSLSSVALNLAHSSPVPLKTLLYRTL